jgi:photosystem II stability/assembly factor-like uncharacterized protein
MRRFPRRSLALVVCLVVSSALFAPPSPAAEKAPARPSPAPSLVSAGLFKGLEFRNIGPANMGGRVDDVAVVESDPAVFYVGMASGGVWKTENGGVTFQPVFDDQPVSSIGDVTLAPSDPQVLYVGTGEPNNRQSSSWGNGVYRTTDGGRTWAHLGLKDTHHIGRIAVHPADPDVVYVAALGRLWGPGKERGLFKSTDGGKAWTNVKYLDEDTGVVDVAMDPASPNILYAASYQRRRTPYGYNGGGPGSGVWKTTDAGATWRRLGKGLPEGEMGRIGLAVFRRDPRIVYALIEHKSEGGIYRSEDRGESWRKMSDTNPRPSYYSKVQVDPSNDLRVWVLGAQMFYSEDGGRTFATNHVQRIHGDYHALWIDPADSDRMVVGSDGGLHLTHDRGKTWDFVNTVPLAQFYEISADSGVPYRVCGGLQDNQSWCGPSRTAWRQGISNEEWFNVGGGDGFYTVLDPADPNIVYVESQDGNVRRFDFRTNEQRVIRPEPADPKERYRFNWNSPLLISPHDSRTIYYGGNRLFGSKDRGETWTLATPDLTSAAARDEMPILGKTAKDFYSRNDGVVHFGTITTLAESPLKAGVLWVGTDDGHLHVSRDGGQTWADVYPRLPGVPKDLYVSRVEASRSGEGAAWAAVDGHRSNDFSVYLFRTEDFGQTWKSVSGSIPAGATVSVVREHPRNADLVFVGTETALWASWNRGGTWHQLKGNLPTVPVDDLLVHPRENDLVLGTHGRGVWILDDVSALSQMSESVAASELHLFDLRPAHQWRIFAHKGNTGHKLFLGPNPPEGALVTYFLKAKPGEKDEVKVVVKDASGEVVRTLTGPKEAGVNRLNWDLRHEAPIPREPGEGGGGGFFGPPRGPWVRPGDYTVTVSLGSASVSKTVQVLEDPRVTISEADRAAWHEASRSAGRLWAQADATNRAATALRRQLTEQREAAGKNAKVPDAVKEQMKAALERVDGVGRRLTRQQPLGFAGAPLATEEEPLLALARGLYTTISSYTAPPTPQHARGLERLRREIAALAATMNEVIDKDVPALNQALFEAGVGRLEGAARIAP